MPKESKRMIEITENTKGTTTVVRINLSAEWLDEVGHMPHFSGRRYGIEYLIFNTKEYIPYSKRPRYDRVHTIQKISYEPGYYEHKFEQVGCADNMEEAIEFIKQHARKELKDILPSGHMFENKKAHMLKS